MINAIVLISQIIKATTPMIVTKSNGVVHNITIPIIQRIVSKNVATTGKNIVTAKIIIAIKNLNTIGIGSIITGKKVENRPTKYNNLDITNTSQSKHNIYNY
jgi:hypothetical protein